MTSIPRLVPFFFAGLAAGPAAALAEPAGAVPVAAVPAFAVAPGVAAPGATPYYPPSARAAEDVATANVGIALRVREDRVAERSYLAPTALVAPAGTATLTIQAPLAPGAMARLNRSFSDRLSLGVGVTGFIDDEDLVGIGSIHGKYQLARGRNAAFAVTASIFDVPAESELADGEDLKIFMPGAAVSLCTSDDCRTLLSLDVEALIGVDDEIVPILGGISLATGFRRQLIAELHTTTADGDRLWAGFIGGRFLGRKLALDVGIGFAAVTDHARTPTCIDFCGEDEPRDGDSDTDGAPYPFIAISSRL